MKKRPILILNLAFDAFILLSGLLVYAMLSIGKDANGQSVVMCLTIASAMLLTHLFWTFTKDMRFTEDEWLTDDVAAEIESAMAEKPVVFNSLDEMMVDLNN